MVKKKWNEDSKLVKIVLANHSPTETMPEDQRNQPEREPHIICAYCYNDWPCLSSQMAEAARAAEPPSVSPVSQPGEPTPDPTNPGLMRRSSQTF